MNLQIKRKVLYHLPFLKTIKTKNELTFWTLSTFGILKPVYIEYLNEALKENGINKEKLTDTDLKKGKEYTPLAYHTELIKYEEKEALFYKHKKILNDNG